MNLTGNKPLWWSNCIHNQKLAMRNRYFKETTVPNNLDGRLIDEIVDEISNQIINLNGSKFKTTTIKEFLSTYTGPLRTRYENGVKKTYEYGLKRKIDIFIKDEFYWEDKPPRTIFSRDYGFNAVYGTITKPVEHAFMQHPEFAKGKNFVERGHMFHEKWLRYKFMIENDFSKFESSQRAEILRKIELRFYLNVFEQDEHTFIKDIFEHKLYKEMSSREGISATLHGCRGSGDMDTSLGNGLLNYVACKYFSIKNCLINKISEQNLIIDGDDSIIFSNRIDDLVETFSNFGFECKLICRKDYHDLDFCSGKFLKINPNQFYYVQNVCKVLDTLQYFKPKSNMNSRQYLYTLGIMYDNLYPNFPIFDQISKGLKLNRQDHTNFAKSLLQDRKYMHAHTKAQLNIDKVLLNAEMRTSFNLNPMQKYNFNAARIVGEPAYKNLNKVKPYLEMYKPQYENIKTRYPLKT